MQFETLALHAGQEPEAATGAVTTPVFQVSTFAQDGIGQPRGYEYARTGNPTRTALETALAALEGGAHGLAFASGLAATQAVFQTLRPGDHVLAGDDLYGGTYRLLEQVMRPWGLQVDYVPVGETAAFAAAWRPATRLLWVESPTNPLLRLADIEALARLARARGARLAVDNTFASPWLQRPLERGAHLVVHSTTKYIGGHSDLVGGAVVTSEADWASQLRFLQNAIGAIPGPWDCWLALRGHKTVAVRVERQTQTADWQAGRLAAHPAVEQVFYPGLKAHPQYELARRQMRAPGAMLSFALRGGFPAVERFVGALELVLLAESLGGVESLICYPPRMTHAALPPAERHRRGITDNLLRLSVGLEHAEDLWHDLEQALEGGSP
ncbi:MAG: aminotransferase class I/II-fold pyridoxal phosphate-dependent enzyme [Candidatus Marinimicrobia bacterium]|nr:aminotransferase class I/II-fold pyridoxal phosphate-dependent enzyme [Candidatus Neomarinimicrobiota bacterium]